MRLALRPHPDSQCAAVSGVEVEVTRPDPQTLALRYIVTGDASAIALPPAVAPGRADDLWRRTCFEAFLLGPGEAGYFEFNFSPSTAWATYAFDGYREGMREAAPIPAPGVTAGPTPAGYELTVAIALPDGSQALSLTAIIDEADGSKSWWALAHPPGKPDFHHPDGFAHRLTEA